MSTEGDPNHLSRINTYWTQMFQAHREGDAKAHEAQRQLLMRYYGSVYRYLLGTLRDPVAAEELTQEFAVDFLAGRYRNADPEKGRFRDFLKTALRHQAMKHWEKQNRQRKRGPVGLPEGTADPPAPPPGPSEDDAAFVQAWREELLAKAWEALRQSEEESGSPYYKVMRLKTEKPDLRSAQMADVLSEQLGKPFREDGVRQILKRARDRFADLLLDEVTASLKKPGLEELERELAELELLAYCQAALKRRKGE
jgi:RNA polymerase sigma-70 factor (ECF subfamily)